MTAYLGVGWQIYSTLAHANPGYNDQEGNLPDGFNVTWDKYPDFNTSRYEVQHYENVTISSRTEGIELDCWWIPANDSVIQPAPTVVQIHGLRASKAGYAMLIVAGMLHDNGFNVLLVDLRDHGHSTIEDGRVSIGTKGPLIAQCRAQAKPVATSKSNVCNPPCSTPETFRCCGPRSSVTRVLPSGFDRSG